MVMCDGAPVWVKRMPLYTYVNLSSLFTVIVFVLNEFQTGAEIHPVNKNVRRYLLSTAPNFAKEPYFCWQVSRTVGTDLGFQDQWFRLFPGKLREKEGKKGDLSASNDAYTLERNLFGHRTRYRSEGDRLSGYSFRNVGLGLPGGNFLLSRSQTCLPKGCSWEVISYDLLKALAKSVCTKRMKKGH
ncbi:hypothetical protein NPIL_91521 [Nephila pilipes]|uniref:Uncharacterized protein n=1 Tax=Nephila pilipes TaxID=299642 RepID=A0A8X6TQU5_NEPPI|nr:hypothetical protein NPIL_91521 [Nephila pilipes]